MSFRNHRRRLVTVIALGLGAGLATYSGMSRAQQEDEHNDRGAIKAYANNRLAGAVPDSHSALLDAVRVSPVFSDLTVGRDCPDPYIIAWSEFPGVVDSSYQDDYPSYYAAWSTLPRVLSFLENVVTVYQIDGEDVAFRSPAHHGRRMNTLLLNENTALPADEAFELSDGIPFEILTSCCWGATWTSPDLRLLEPGEHTWFFEYYDYVGVPADMPVQASGTIRVVEGCPEGQ